MKWFRDPIPNKDLVAGLDIGSNKICCAIAKIDNKKQLKIIGSSQQISKGIKGACIIDMESLEDTILNVVHSAEQAAKVTIAHLYVSVPAQKTFSYTLESSINVNNSLVEDSHIRKLLQFESAKELPKDQELLHALPINYILDENKGIKDPRGMMGNKLTVLVNAVASPASLLRNLRTCIGKCHLDVASFVSSAYASGLACLVEDEMELGVTLVDIGGDHTSIACFLDGTLLYLDHVPLGGTHITNDIARGLSTPLAQAERLKNLHGNLLSAGSDEREVLYVPQLGENQNLYNQTVSKALLLQIIVARVEEILELVWKRLRSSGMDRLVGHKLVLTGGSAQLPGLREFAGKFWGRSVRIGQPEFAKDEYNTVFSTTAGLLNYAVRDIDSKQELYTKKRPFFGRWFKEKF